MVRSSMRVCIIVNPIAGRGKAPERARAVEKALTDEGVDVNRVVTEAPGHATRLAREAAGNGADVVLVCGGDGTVNEAVQGLVGADAALALVPVGLANVLARELRLGRRIEDVTRTVLHGRVRKLDLGRCGGQFFACMASAGFDAFVTERMAAWRKGAIGYSSYVPFTWSALAGYPFEPLRLRVDGRPLDAPVYHVIVGNTRSYGGPFTMTPGARPDDGLLDACVFGGRGRLRVMLYMCAAAVQVHHRLPGVVCVRGKRFEVDSDAPVPVQLDGDFRMHTPVSIELAPRAIAVMTPAGGGGSG